MSITSLEFTTRFGAWRGLLGALTLLALPACGAADPTESSEDTASPSAAAEQALGAPVFSFKETWENFRPVFDGSAGARVFTVTGGAFSGSTSTLIGAVNNGWASVGRDVTPNASGSVVCFAQMVLRNGDAKSTAANQVSGGIEVIDAARWSFVTVEPVTLRKNDTWKTYTTAGWTQIKPLFVRAAVYGKSSGKEDFIRADDLVVKCIPKPSAQQLRDECTNKCSSPCTAGFTGGSTEGIAQCIQSCADRCVARGHTF